MRIGIYTFIICFLNFNSTAQTGAFELLSSEKTGITFNNKVVENLSTKENLFDYDYFYNGAGVGVLDVNNDGLQDIYFASNQVGNKLYLNKGNFEFEDITNTAFPNFFSKWSTGVSIVDINNDGWQDIYVCQGGPFNDVNRENLLFVNKGDNTFVESAYLYGLADQGMSTQGVFFDFDRDGDLDCFVMNESLAYGLDPVTFTKLNLERKRDLYVSYSHMYENIGGTYVDKTKELGITDPTFGLGLKIGDFNGDGWEDLYVSNDYYIPDMMLINQKGEGFRDDIDYYVKQMSFYGMGLDIADINNDGMSDIFVLDMASGDHYRSKTLMRSMNVENFRLLVDGLQMPHQYMYNSLQISNDNGTYSNISQLAGVSSTDWSWSALIEDFDFDGHKDVHITNGYRKYALDNDFQAKINAAKEQYNNQVPLEVKRELYAQMPTEKLANIFYKNQGNLVFDNWQFDESINPPSYSNGAAIVDLDNDGDPDLVINNLDDEAFVYKNLAVESKKNNWITFKQKSDASPKIEKINITIKEHELSFEPSIVRGYLSSSEPSVFIGLNQQKEIDQAELTWSNGEKEILKDINLNTINFIEYNQSNKGLKNNEKEAKLYFDEIIPTSIGLDYTHEENEYDDFEKEILLPYKQSTLGPFVTDVDLNNDGLSDLIFSNSKGNSIKMYIQNDTGFVEKKLPHEQLFTSQENGHITTSDLNNDGFQDILLSATGNEEPDLSPYYQSKILMSNKNQGYTISELPLTSGSSSIIVSIDYDQDGNEDIIECKRHVAQKYPMHAPSHIYKNNKLSFEDVTASVFPDLESYGIINDILVTDFNQDNVDDVIIVGEWSDIRFYKNKKGKFINVTQDLNIPELKGMWFSIEEADINKDGKPDYIVGNIGSNSKYKASNEKPLKIYGNDFDKNGTWDLVLSKKYKDEYVPLRGLECSSQQMPFIDDKFETYDLFAKASIDDVYGPSLEDAYYRFVTTMKSVLLMSNKNDGYKVIELPSKAQIAPILDIETHDVNGDDLVDIIVSGNIYDTEVETPRLDGGQGTVLLNTSNESFRIAGENTSGLNLNNNIKSTTKVWHAGGNCHLFIATDNGGPIRTFIINK